MVMGRLSKKPSLGGGLPHRKDSSYLLGGGGGTTSVFLCKPRQFDFLNCGTEMTKCSNTSAKFSHSKMLTSFTEANNQIGTSRPS